MDLVERVGISSSTLAKMSKGEIVSLTVLEKICDELNCDFGDLISYDRKRGKKMMEYNVCSVNWILLWHVEKRGQQFCCFLCFNMPKKKFDAGRIVFHHFFAPFRS